MSTGNISHRAATLYGAGDIRIHCKSHWKLPVLEIRACMPYIWLCSRRPSDQRFDKSDRLNFRQVDTSSRRWLLFPVVSEERQDCGRRPRHSRAEKNLHSQIFDVIITASYRRLYGKSDAIPFSRHWYLTTNHPDYGVQPAQEMNSSLDNQFSQYRDQCGRIIVEISHERACRPKLSPLCTCVKEPLFEQF